MRSVVGCWLFGIAVLNNQQPTTKNQQVSFTAHSQRHAPQEDRSRAERADRDRSQQQPILSGHGQLGGDQRPERYRHVPVQAQRRGAHPHAQAHQIRERPRRKGRGARVETAAEGVQVHYGHLPDPARPRDARDGQHQQGGGPVPEREGLHHAQLHAVVRERADRGGNTSTHTHRQVEPDRQ
jgi:hypothetical protein